jgi:hypothetical protein
MNGDGVGNSHQVFNGATQEGDKTVKAKGIFMPTGRAASNDTSREPTQDKPDVEQQQG